MAPTLNGLTSANILLVNGGVEGGWQVLETTNHSDRYEWNSGECLYYIRYGLMQSWRLDIVRDLASCGEHTDKDSMMVVVHLDCKYR